MHYFGFKQKIFFLTSDYITGATSSSNDGKKEKSPFSIDEKDFEDYFHRTIILSLTSVAENQFRKLRCSIYGKDIIQLCNLISKDSKKINNIALLLKSPFYKIFNSCSRKELNIKEEIFMYFHEVSLDILHPFVNIVNENVEEVLPFQQFCGIFLHQLLEDLINITPPVNQTDVTLTSKPISDRYQFHHAEYFGS